MALGYDRPLYLMAFDHRGSFEHGLFGATPPVSAAVHAGITDAKEVIFDAPLKALTDGAGGAPGLPGRPGDQARRDRQDRCPL